MPIIPETLPPGFIYFDMEGAKKKARQALLDLIAWAGYRTRLARILDTHEQNVYQWCRRGEISRPWALRVDARDDIPFTKEQLRPDVQDWDEIDLEALPEPVPYNKPDNPEVSSMGVRPVRDWYKPRAPRPKKPKVKKVKPPKPPKPPKIKKPKVKKPKKPKRPKHWTVADLKIHNGITSPAAVRRARKARAEEQARLKAEKLAAKAVKDESVNTDSGI